MGVQRLVRRMWSDRLAATALAVTVMLAMLLLAAGPIYSDAVALCALRRSLTDAPARDTVIGVDVRAAPAEFELLDDLVADRVERATSRVGADISRSIVSAETFEVPGRRGVEQVDLAQFSWIESVEQHVTVVAGTWPDDNVEQIEVAIDRRVAETFGLDVGDVSTLRPRTGSAPPVTMSITAVYVVDDPFGAFWEGRHRWTEGVRASRLFRTARILTSRSAMLSGVAQRVEAGWLAVPLLDRVEMDDVGPTRRLVAALGGDLDDAIAALDHGPVRARIEVDTALPSLLVGSERALSVARSAVFAVVIQLALLAGYALLLVAGLTVDARRAESALLRARGAGSRQLLGSAVFEAMLFVVPAAVIAPGLASWLLRSFDDVGPLASIGLEIDPRPVGAAWLAVALAGLVTVLLLAWPAYRVARNAEQEQHRHRRQRPRTAGQRAGVDVALVVLSVVAFWQLSTLDDQRASSVRGRFGVDPLLIVAPTFGLVAGSILALRAIPVLARVAEHHIGRSRTIVPALSGWQFARRPTRYGRSGLLLIMAFAIGTFAATYEATWTRSQGAQAAHQVGADARLTPNRRTNESVTDLQLVAMHEQLDDITRSVPVVSKEVDLPGTDRPARVLAIDAARAGPLWTDADTSRPLLDALRMLAARRPEMVGVELRGSPSRLGLSLVVRAESDELAATGIGQGQAEAPPPQPSGAVSVVLQDGHGLLHRLDLGAISELSEIVTLEAELAVPGVDGRPVAPVSPLSLVDIELRIATPPPPGRTFLLDVLSLESTDSAGIRRTIDLSRQPWRFVSTPLGFVHEQPSLERSAEQPAGGLGLIVETGSARLPIPVLFDLRPTDQDPQGVPSAIGTSSWMAQSGTSVGDVISVDLLRAEPVEVEIVAVVDAIPTVDPSVHDALMIDLPTLEMLEYGPGWTQRIVSEHWLALADVAREIEPQVGRPPIEAVEVIVLEHRRAALMTDPPALSAIGALMLGFVAAAIFAFVGFIVTTVVSARERRTEFALLRALGLTMRQLRRWMLIEQLGLITVGVLFGTAIGLGLGALMLPLVSLTQAGDAVYPPVEVVYPWTTYLVLQAVVIAAVVIGLAIVDGAVRRVVHGSALRAGDEP